MCVACLRVKRDRMADIDDGQLSGSGEENEDEQLVLTLQEGMAKFSESTKQQVKCARGCAPALPRAVVSTHF
jgi:hypothetical protein